MSAPTVLIPFTGSSQLTRTSDLPIHMTIGELKASIAAEYISVEPAIKPVSW